MQTSNEKRKISIKIVMLGDTAVGKTSLVKQYVKHKFSTDLITTIGMDITAKDIQIDGIDFSIQIWDIGGYKKFHKIRPSYYKGARGYILVYDLTNPESFNNVDYWINDVKQSRGDLPMILLGNKFDLIEEPSIKTPIHEESSPLIKEYAARKLLTDWVFTSAKTSYNLDNAFRTLVKSIYEHYNWKIKKYGAIYPSEEKI